MEKQPIQPVIIRYYPHKLKSERHVILFIPDMDVNEGRIMCYAGIGQHSEASMDYYYDTKPIHYASLELQKEAGELLAEYRRICHDNGGSMKVVFKDQQKYRDARWGWRERIEL